MITAFWQANACLLWRAMNKRCFLRVFCNGCVVPVSLLSLCLVYVGPNIMSGNGFLSGSWQETDTVTEINSLQPAARKRINRLSYLCICRQWRRRRWTVRPVQRSSSSWWTSAHRAEHNVKTASLHCRRDALAQCSVRCLHKAVIFPPLEIVIFVIVNDSTLTYTTYRLFYFKTAAGL